MHFYTAVISVLFASSCCLSAEQAPYAGKALPLPGTIEFENYDQVGLGEAFNNLTPSNAGNSTLQGDCVDLTATKTAPAVGVVSSRLNNASPTFLALLNTTSQFSAKATSDTDISTHTVIDFDATPRGTVGTSPIGPMDITNPRNMVRWGGIVIQTINQLKTKDHDERLHSLLFTYLGVGIGHPNEVQAGASN